MSLQHVRVEAAVFLQDKQQKDRLFDADDGDGRSCLVRLKRIPQTPGYISLSCETVVKAVLARPDDWAKEYAALRQKEGDRYEVRGGEYHERRELFMLLTSVADSADGLELIVRKVDHYLYTLRGLDDYTREWYERFRHTGYPSPQEVYDWLGPSGSVYA